jgi:hypothetical protein
MQISTEIRSGNAIHGTPSINELDELDGVACRTERYRQYLLSRKGDFMAWVHEVARGASLDELMMLLFVTTNFLNADARFFEKEIFLAGLNNKVKESSIGCLLDELSNEDFDQIRAILEPIIEGKNK